MSAAGKLALLMDLLKRTEIHECDECGHSHEVELGILEKEEIKKLLNQGVEVDE